MRRKKSLNPAKRVRAGVVVVLSLFMVLIIIHFIFRSLKKSEVKTIVEELPEQKVERVEDLFHLELEGERGNFSLKAKKHYLGQDGRYHLEGGVEVIDYGKVESENVFFKAEKVVYDKDMLHFSMEGKSEVRYRGFKMSSSGFEYHRPRELFTSRHGVVFESQKLKGKASIMSYSLRTELLRLSRNIRLELPPSQGASPLVVRAERLDYSRRQKAGEAWGKVILKQRENSARASRMKFFLSPDEEDVERIIFQGKVSASLEARRGEARRSEIFYQALGKKEVEADELLLSFEEGISGISLADASGNCRFRAYDECGNFYEVKGGKFSFIFSAGGEVEKFTATEEVKAVVHEEGKSRFLEGYEVELEREEGTITLKGSNSHEARFVSEQSEMTAERIILSLGSEDLEASGGVRLNFQKLAEEEKPGYFSAETPLFVFCGRMRFQSSERRFLFEKGVRLWQESWILVGDELSLDERSGEMICQGRVRAVFMRKLAGGKGEEKIEVTSGQMKYEPQSRSVSFEGKTSLKAGVVEIVAHSLTAFLGQGEGGIESFSAKKEVSLKWKRMEGKAEQVSFDPEREAFIFSGNPVFEEKGRAATRGGKLTFYPGDGRIVVEDRQRERTVTVIKS